MPEPMRTVFASRSVLAELDVPVGEGCRDNAAAVEDESEGRAYEPRSHQGTWSGHRGLVKPTETSPKLDRSAAVCRSGRPRLACRGINDLMLARQLASRYGGPFALDGIAGRAPHRLTDPPHPRHGSLGVVTELLRDPLGAVLRSELLEHSRDHRRDLPRVGLVRSLNVRREQRLTHGVDVRLEHCIPQLHIASIYGHAQRRHETSSKRPTALKVKRALSLHGT